MTTQTPEYATNQFFKKVLENGWKIENIDIEDFTISSIGGGGENYTSNIFHILVKYKTCDNIKKEISLIIKDLQTKGDHVKILKDLKVFNTEKMIYVKIMPQIEELLGSNIMMAPKCFYTCEDDDIFVFQDLKALGYELGDRLKGLDYHSCEIAIKKIGQYHAATMVLAKKDPESMRTFKNGLFNERMVNSSIFKGIFETNFNYLIKTAETWPDCDVIVKKLKKIQINYAKRCIDLFEPKNQKLFVLNHGDLWINNFMLKYDPKNNPIDVSFIDYQISFYGSPGIDLNYFLALSPQLNVLKSERYNLLKEYYHSLKTRLEQFNYSSIPLWDDIKKEVRSKEFFTLAILAGIFPIIAMDRSLSQNASIETLLNTDEIPKYIEQMFSSNRIRNTIEYSLNRLDDIGVLDD